MNILLQGISTQLKERGYTVKYKLPDKSSVVVGHWVIHNGYSGAHINIYELGGGYYASDGILISDPNLIDRIIDVIGKPK